MNGYGASRGSAILKTKLKIRDTGDSIAVHLDGRPVAAKGGLRSFTNCLDCKKVL